MRPAARATTVAGIALLLVLCRLVFVANSAHAQSFGFGSVGESRQRAWPESARGAPFSPALSQVGEPSAVRPGFTHRTYVRLPTAAEVERTIDPAYGGYQLAAPNGPASNYRRTISQPPGAAGPGEALPPGVLLPEGRLPRVEEGLPDPLGGDVNGSEFRGAVEPFFGEIIEGGGYFAPPAPRPSFLQQWFSALRQSRQRGGIGRDRLAFVPFEVESSQPANMLTLKFESVYGLEFPDRSEYFWARTSALPPGRGPPLFEQRVDYQDVWLRTEVGGAKFSATTEMVLRSLNPVNNANTTGMGDMNFGAKLVVIDGENTQLSSVFRTYILSGVPAKGLGTGHVSLEPGLLFRHKLNDFTWFSGETKFWIPIGGDPNQSGEVLRYGFALSRLMYDSDRLAILPVAEIGGLMFFSGQKSLPDGTVVNVDGEGVINFLPGVRFAVDNGGDLGLTEIGVAGGFSMGSEGWYDGMFRTDIRWSF